MKLRALEGAGFHFGESYAPSNIIEGGEVRDKVATRRG